MSLLKEERERKKKVASLTFTARVSWGSKFVCCFFSLFLSRMREVVVADFKPLRHLYVHVIQPGRVVLHLHRLRVRDVRGQV